MKQSENWVITRMFNVFLWLFFNDKNKRENIFGAVGIRNHLLELIAFV